MLKLSPSDAPHPANYAAPLGKRKTHPLPVAVAATSADPPASPSQWVRSPEAGSKTVDTSAPPHSQYPHSIGQDTAASKFESPNWQSAYRPQTNC